MLDLKIYSFSFKDIVPGSDSPHGGGFVFDCRCLPNPGRLEEYKVKTGLDQEVKDFLNKEEKVQSFWKNVSGLVDQAVATYLERDFDSLVIAFGCTGGQHRSVYFAEKLQTHLKSKADVSIEVMHCRKDRWPK